MKSKFEFTRLEMTLLISNTIALGGCVTLLLLGRASGPLALLTVGVVGMLIANLGKAYFRARHSDPTMPPSQTTQIAKSHN